MRAVDIIGAERIGHGLMAARSEQALRLLRERKVAVEICLSSNMCTKVIATAAEHPIKQFIAAGIY